MLEVLVVPLVVTADVDNVDSVCPVGVTVVIGVVCDSVDDGTLVDVSWLADV